jgi:hypothetical protein
MANAALTDSIRAAGDKFFTALKPSFGDLVTKDGEKVDVGATKRAMFYALKSYLRSTGQIATRAPIAHSVDWAEVINAAVTTFAKQATDAASSIEMMAVCYGAVSELQPSFADYQKVQKLVHEALLRPESPLEIYKPGKGVGANLVRIKADTKLPKPHPVKLWADLTAGASDDGEPEAPKAEATKGKGKGKGK